MKITLVSMVSIKDFIELNFKFAHTVKHYFNRSKNEIISGKAELFEERARVKYIYDLSNCMLSITYKGILLCKQEAITKRDLLTAFERADENFFLMGFVNSPEIISSSDTEKGRRCLQYSKSKKAIKANHRGQKARWKEGRAIKGERMDWHYDRRRPISEADFSETKVDEFLPEYEDALFYDCLYNSFLDNGMIALIEPAGKIGAVSFNPSYFNSEIILSN